MVLAAGGLDEVVIVVGHAGQAVSRRAGGWIRGRRALLLRTVWRMTRAGRPPVI